MYAFESNLTHIFGIKIDKRALYTKQMTITMGKAYLRNYIVSVLTLCKLLNDKITTSSKKARQCVLFKTLLVYLESNCCGIL